ncbi:MAG: DUF4340 domain-containing protein [Gemmataceae bacterium]
MNNNTTYLLFGLLVVLLGLLGFVLYQGPNAPSGADAIFPSMHAKADPVKAKDITKVVVHRKKPVGDDMIFERVDDNTWKITSPRALPADSGRVGGLVDSLIDARTADEPAPSGAKAAGLDSPSRVITLHGKDREWTLTVGEVTPGEESAVAYVSTSDRGGKPLAVRKQSIDSALEGLSYFRSKDLLGDNTSDVRVIKVSEGKKAPVELRKDKDRWTMVQPPYGAVEGSDIVNKLNDLRVEHRNSKESDFVKDGVEKLGEYNLDPQKNDVLTISVTRGEGDKATTTTATVGVGKKIDGDKKFYAAMGGGKAPDVIKVTTDSVKPFQELIDTPGKYRPKNLVQLDGFRQPDAIDVTGSYGTLEFRHPDSAKPWELYRGDASNPVDEQEVKRLVDELTRKDLVTDYVDPKRKKELGLEKPDVTVKVYTESLDKPDEKAKSKKPALKKDAKPAAELRFGNRERDQVAVERVWGSDSAIVLVPQALLDQVRKGPLAYLDKSIPPFNTGASDQDVTKVEITRGGETFEAERATAKDPWKFTKPAALKGKQANANALRDVLDELNRMRAEEVVAEKADAKELAGYDLAKPPVKVVVTVTKDKKAEAKTFDLGKEAGGKGVYFKRSDREPIYLVGASILGTLKRELRDPTVFRFDPERVTSLAVKGWEKAAGTPLTLSLERKDGKWEVKTPAGFTLDADKATDLVRELSRLQAERFGAAPKGLRLSEGALEVTVGLPDKKSVSLTVGEMDGAGFVATSDELKGEVFVIPRGSFEEMKKALTYFKK